MHFNPRSREGSDVVFIHWSFIVAYFNPRSREGSDEQSFPNLTELLTISIHAPAKGATHSMQIDCRDRENFNPRSREWSDGIY